MNSFKSTITNLKGDIVGGISATFLALPSAIAFGFIIYAPLIVAAPIELRPLFSGMAAIGGIVGTIAMGLFTPLTGSTKRLISAPGIPAAAVLSVFVAELIKKGNVPLEFIPVYITLVGLFAGVLQLIIGNLGGGKFIKYIPYPVVSGYLNGVSILIIFGQLPKFFGMPKGTKLINSFFLIDQWRWESIIIGLITIIVMFFASKFVKSIPIVIIALLAGFLTYFAISVIHPNLLSLDNNNLVIGNISASSSDLFNIIKNRWALLAQIDINSIGVIITPVITLSIILSINTLNACLSLDTTSEKRHNSQKELTGQGIGNIISALICGIPGAGAMSATTVNIKSGGKTQLSGFFVGVTSLIAFLLLGKLIGWIPLAALAGILIFLAIRMIDTKSFLLLKNKSTVLDFIVMILVVIAALNLSLIAAAGVGIALSIFLYIREQMRTSVIRRMLFGSEFLSKKIRIQQEIKILEEKGKQTVILELQGQLFFGTTDQLYSVLEAHYSYCKYVIMDMRRVQSVDYTSVKMLLQILARLKRNNGFLIFTSIPLSLPTGQKLREYFEDLGLYETESLKLFDTLDFALEWVEDEILKEENISVTDDKVLNLNELELFEGLHPDILSVLNDCMVEKQYNINEIIFKTGGNSDEIFFVRQGTVKIFLTLNDGKQYHLLTIGKGGIFGEMAFIDKSKRSADALALSNLHLYTFSRKKFEEIQQKYPEISGLFFEKLAFLVANRLRRSNIELTVFQEN